MPPSITLFSNLTNPTGPELDNNFLAYAVFDRIPCTVSGTNNLTLAQNSNTPNLTQLTNYIVFTGVFVGINTGAVTINHPSFGTLNCYKDSATGPVAFSGGECRTGNAFSAVYDSALNSGAGGYHLYTNTAYAGGTITGNMVLSGATLSVIGGSVGASLTSAVLTGNSLTVSALLANYSLASLAAGTVSSLKIGVLGSTLATLTRAVSASGTLAYTAITPNNTQDQNLVVPGAQVRDVVSLGITPPSGAGFNGFCGTLGTVTVRLINPAAASTIAATTLTVRALAMGVT